MRKSIHGFPFLLYMSMVLRVVVLPSAGAPLLKRIKKKVFSLGEAKNSDFTNKNNPVFFKLSMQ